MVGVGGEIDTARLGRCSKDERIAVLGGRIRQDQIKNETGNGRSVPTNSETLPRSAPNLSMGDDMSTKADLMLEAEQDERRREFIDLMVQMYRKRELMEMLDNETTPQEIVEYLIDRASTGLAMMDDTWKESMG